MKIGFACGVFDLFHAGHVLMLEECRRNCDYLIVALNSAENFDRDINPEKKTPVYSLKERVLIMKSCRYVDEVLEYKNEQELLSILQTRKIDVRFLGDDYRNKPITGMELKIPVYYTDRSHGLSTSNFRERILKSEL
jgi:glycerol-3-phosphate cytidylyltransferase